MSIMLETDEVDDGYFTPNASTTLANIFKDDSSNETTANASLKYKPPQLKKMDESTRTDDVSTSQCVFSCSVIAYEWVQQTHKCKGKIGFAMMKKAGTCKIILYSPDKSTLSCTTVTPQLEVTMSSGAMISFYDDHKKYWGLCFNDKHIEEVKDCLKKENVAIKPYKSPEFKPEVENIDSDETTDEAGSNSTTEEGPAKPQNIKASILNRIANVGHAILPSMPISPVKRNMPLEASITQDLLTNSKFNVLPNVSTNRDNAPTQDQELTKSIAIQTSQTNMEMNNLFSLNKTECGQTSITSVPLVNNQIFTYVNGYMVPLHMQVPVINNLSGTETSAEIDVIIHKLTQLKNAVKTVDTKQSQNNDKFQNDLYSNKISALEKTIREKDEIIRDLENIRNDLSDRVNYLNNQVQKTMENFESDKKIADKEEHIHLNRKVKMLMNNTFHSLASNFDNDANYSGNNVKSILAAVIKKITIESLANVFPSDATTSTKEND